MNTNEFIVMIADTIQRVAFSRGYKYPSSIIAQAIIESGNGNSLLAKKYHNYFGLKCGSSWTGKSVNMRTKEEYTKGTITNIRDNFRVFDTMEKGVQGYFDFISTKRYANLKKATSSYNYLELIKQDGYATSYSYVETVYSVVKKFNLEKYDRKGVTNVKKEDLTSKVLNGDEIITILAKEVIQGKYGYGKEREKQLGCLYDLVQKKVNELLFIY